MKKTFLLLAIVCSTNCFSIDYFPFVKENAEWQGNFTDYPYELMQGKTMTPQTYILHGDTVIDNRTYKRLCMKTGPVEQPVYQYYGAIREQNKQVFYIGRGYYGYPQQANRERIKRMKDCLFSEYDDSQEILLYDFNAQLSDFMHLGYDYSQIVAVDSVWVGGSYRRRLHLAYNSDVIVEGIGTVKKFFLSSVTPIPTCGGSGFYWEFDSFSQDGKVVYRSPSNIRSTGYQTVYSHRKAYYQTEPGRIETLKIDSIAYLNDSVFYPSRAIRLVGDQCYSPYGSGWTGKKIVINNHWNYFFNDDKDTIKIKTDAVLNENWTLFRRPDITIIATVTKWDTATVMSVVDSVKAITLKIYDMSMSPLPHRLDGATIELSKNYGLTKTLNFHSLPTAKYVPADLETDLLYLVGLTNPEMGVQNVKWFEVFDYQEGDEFHYVDSEYYMMQGGNTLERKYIVRIMKREDLNNSIRYTEDVESLSRYKQNASADFVTTYNHYQRTNVIDENAEFDREPGTLVFNEDSTVLYVTSNFGFNGWGQTESYSKENGCWRKSIICDDGCSFMGFAKGRGMISSGGGCWPEYAYSESQQVYYRKGTESWGVPLVLTGIRDVEGQQAVDVYPNPVSDDLFVNVKGFSKSCTFELLDAQGRLVQQTSLNVQNNHLNLHGLNSGLYFYRIMSDNEQIKTGRIIKKGQL